MDNKCVECGDQFASPRRAVYCSQRCSSAAWKRKGGTPTDDGLYGCTRCNRLLPPRRFAPSQLKLPGRWCTPCQTEHKRNKRAGISSPRLTDVCLYCGIDIRHMRSHAKYCSTSCGMNAHRQRHPQRRREYLMKSLYGLTPAEFDRMFKAQGYACAICRTTDGNAPEMASSRQWNVDHDHNTGTVRGILCSLCNWGIGMFKESPQRLRLAIEYLERTKEDPPSVAVTHCAPVYKCT